MSDWLSLSAYARAYGVHRNTVTKWRKAGLLDVWTVGPTVRVRNVPPAQTCSIPKTTSSETPARGVIMNAPECAKH